MNDFHVTANKQLMSLTDGAMRKNLHVYPKTKGNSFSQSPRSRAHGKTAHGEIEPEGQRGAGGESHGDALPGGLTLQVRRFRMPATARRTRRGDFLATRYSYREWFVFYVFSTYLGGSKRCVSCLLSLLLAPFQDAGPGFDPHAARHPGCKLPAPTILLT